MRAPLALRYLILLVALAAADPAAARQKEGQADLDAAFQRGAALRKQGKMAEALPQFEKALSLAKDVFGPDHLNTAAIMNTTGVTCLDLGRTKDAEKHFRGSL